MDIQNAKGIGMASIILLDVPLITSGIYEGNKKKIVELGTDDVDL